MESALLNDETSVFWHAEVLGHRVQNILLVAHTTSAVTQSISQAALRNSEVCTMSSGCLPDLTLKFDVGTPATRSGVKVLGCKVCCKMLRDRSRI